MTSNQVRERVEPYVRQALPEGWINGKTVWHINPTGKFYIGGPDGDAGLTGRKIIVDTYGGAAPHVGASARRVITSARRLWRDFRRRIHSSVPFQRNKYAVVKMAPSPIDWTGTPQICRFGRQVGRPIAQELIFLQKMRLSGLPPSSAAHLTYRACVE